MEQYACVCKPSAPWPRSFVWLCAFRVQFTVGRSSWQYSEYAEAVSRRRQYGSDVSMIGLMRTVGDR